MDLKDCHNCSINVVSLGSLRCVIQREIRGELGSGVYIIQRRTGVRGKCGRSTQIRNKYELARKTDAQHAVVTVVRYDVPLIS